MNREIGTRSSQPLQSASRSMARLQRKCDCGNHMIGGGKCADCNTEERRLQRASMRAHGTSAGEEVPSVVHDVLRSSGQPLDSATRAFMEPRFGHDFSQVRVHTDAKAAESAQAVNALAYTVGRDVVFGAAQYAPTMNEGKKLLAHELTHVVQQGGMAYDPQEKLTLGAVDNHSEQQAGEAEQITSTDSSPRAPTQAWNPASSIAKPGTPVAARALQRRVNPNLVSCNPPSAAIAAITGPDPVGPITAANARAIELLGNVIDELQATRDNIVAGADPSFPTVSDGVAQALQDRFHMDASDRNIWTRRGEGTIDVLIRRFRGARQILADGAMRYQCLGGAAITFTGGARCAGPACTGGTRAVSCEGASLLVLCAPFWSDAADDQAATLMHECFHIYFGFIGDTGNLANAHCYEQFVSDFNAVAVPAVFAGSCP